ncbi:hypothetical protein ONA70_32135 [Micromonospora yasonensis]|uniref:hypothetical protein n=1 Tax=Micromonospora yasonensis TaxID=1128667 RepID=UPI00223178DA|nr:hypothetical protein [Micromonospora yasonensis]MCW3844738.1 hypothetical protein [Micromonospora yasonensis]
MSHVEVERALDLSANMTTSGPPYSTVSEATFSQLGLHTRYTPNERLCYVAIAPPRGRQVTLNGIGLVGGFFSRLARELGEHTRSCGLGPLTGGPARSARHDGLGLVLRPYRYHDLVLTKPGFFTPEWLDDPAEDFFKPDTGPNLTARVRWDAEPLVRVGPLRFGMSSEQVIGVLGTIPDRREVLPDDPAPLIQVGLCLVFTQPAVTAYFDESDRLCCIAVDGTRGPQVTLGGSDLVGQIPSDLEDRFVHFLVGSVGYFYYTLQGDPASDELGLVLRTQRSGDILVTRPFFSSRAWAERHHDTYDGPVPAVEWRST